MNYGEAVNYLYGLGNEVLAMKLGLENVRRLSVELGDPHTKFPAVHVAGTNGKGSTCAMIDAIARQGGLRVGLYTSPHLVKITERIKIDGQEISEEEFARLATRVRAACERLAKEDIRPTFFEQITMIAFLAFAEARVDLAVLEVGLGGRLDATNICRPVVTAITQIAFDHEKILGATLAAIAGEKAGIIKPSVPVVVAPQADGAMAVIRARALERQAPLVAVGEATQITASETGEDTGRFRFRYQTAVADYDLRLGLRGRHQSTNALVALHMAEQLAQAGWPITNEAIMSGLACAQWPGRLELLQTSAAPVLLDGAHNPAGIAVLRDFLRDHFRATPITLIFGALNDKPGEAMLRPFVPLVARLLVTKVTNPRAADPAQLAAVAGADAILTDDLNEAMEAALRVTPPDGLIVVCGSLFLVGEARAWLGQQAAGVVFNPLGAVA